MSNYTEIRDIIIKNFSDKVLNILKSPDIMPCLLIFLFLLTIVIFLAVLIVQIYFQASAAKIVNVIDVFNVVNVSSTANKKSDEIDKIVISCKYIFFLLFLLFMAIGSLLLLNNKKDRKVIFGTILSFCVLLFVLIFYYNGSSPKAQTYTYFLNKIFFIIVLFIIIVALALVYKFFGNSLRNRPGVWGFIFDLIFLIPCLFSDGLEYVMKQIRMTTNSVFVLFVLEILLVIGYIAVPLAINRTIEKDSVPILRNYLFLDTPQKVPTDTLPLITITDTNAKTVTNTPNANYGISMWIYLNQQSHNNTDAATKNILSYGSDTYGMKPQVLYLNSSDTINVKDVYQITFSGSPDPEQNANRENTSMLLEMTAQKWNHLVFNYWSAGSQVELYLNGNLVRVFKFDSTHPYPRYHSGEDVLTVGDSQGLDGAICNIAYYKNTLTMTQISTMYKLLSNKNPPTVAM